ncbi:hypothetical protein D3C85_1280790 [compost metagenome]
MMMNSPVIRSATSDCAPKPMARPITPAPASSGVTFMPMLARATITAMMKMTTNITLRINGIMVCARALARPRRERTRAWCTAVSARIHTSQATISVPARPSRRTLMSWPSPSAKLIIDRPHTRSPSSMNTSQMNRCTSR